MSIQWTLIAGFLYIEIAIVLLLVLPVASPKRWNAFFRSRFLQALRTQAGMYFFILLGVLVLFLLDAIREMHKYSTAENEDAHKHLNVEMQGHMRLFRAQRNFYISGFALFLALVIRRLVILISSQAGLLAQCEASMRQAESATTAARSMLNDKLAKDGGAVDDGKKKDKKEKGSGDASEDEEDLRAALKVTRAELEAARKDKEAMRKQAESLATEYDRLTEQYSQLQKKVHVGEGKKGE